MLSKVNNSRRHVYAAFAGGETQDGTEGERNQGGRERLGLKVGERDDIASKNNLGNHLISDLPQRNFW